MKKSQRRNVAGQKIANVRSAKRKDLVLESVKSWKRSDQRNRVTTKAALKIRSAEKDQNLVIMMLADAANPMKNVEVATKIDDAPANHQIVGEFKALLCYPQEVELRNESFQCGFLVGNLLRH